MFHDSLSRSRCDFSLRAALIILALTGLGAIMCRASITHAQESLRVTASFTGRSEIAPHEPVALSLSRPLEISEGRLGIFLGDLDLTALFDVEGETRVYRAQAFPLPSGESVLTVYLVSPVNAWQEIGRFNLTVGASAARPASRPRAEAKRFGFDKLELNPALTLNLKAESTLLFFPGTNRPQRLNFTDVDLQGSLGAAMQRGRLRVESKHDVVGISNQQAALRFGQENRAAPQIDLASYLTQVQLGAARFSLGHVAFGSNRQLANNFSSRGLTFTFPLRKRLDFSFAAANGTSIVGWDNYAGLNRRRHQLMSGTIGYEFLRERPGGLRLELSALHGSLLPLSSFNQRNVNDAERSRGAGVRLLASDQEQRLRLDGGFTRNRFTNPRDPLLEQGLDVTPIRATTRNARYLDASYNFLRNLSLTETKKVNFTFGLRHERIEPLYRSVAASLQADRVDNQFDLTGNIGELNLTATHQRFHDNLNHIPSILRTLTRREALIIGAPLTSFFTDPTRPSPWLPRLSYGYDRIHQFGRDIPANGNFNSPSQVPDQMSFNQTFASEWQTARGLRLGYRFNRSRQDNRQPGRESADLQNTVNSFTFGLNPLAALDLNFDAGLESGRNFELDRTDRTIRVGSQIIWRMSSQATLGVNFSTTVAGDRADASDTRNAEFDAQWSWRFTSERHRWRKVQGQFFLRYANRYAFTRDNIFGLHNLVKLQTANAGISFTFF